MQHHRGHPEARGAQQATRADLLARFTLLLTLLVYERQSQLFLTGRRLADLYRFGLQSDAWDPDSDAATLPGTLFPIPATEVESNCYLNGSCA